MAIQTSTKPLPFFFVGKSITTDRVNNYMNQKHNLLSQGIGKPDTKSIWYSKDHILKLLEEIEFAEGDGLLVQFGMYESSHEFSGQLCLLMNTTKEEIVGGNILHRKVVLEHQPDFAERSALPREKIVLAGNDLFAPTIRDFNYGSPCPPRCDGFDEEI